MVLVDFHAEATSEKQALGFYLDGRVSAVLGTHTHVPTADERVLPNGTALQTDVGMTGPYESVIGMRVDKVLKRFLLQTPSSFEVAKRDVRLAGALVDIDEATGKARAIERLLVPDTQAEGLAAVLRPSRASGRSSRPSRRCPGRTRRARSASTL